MNIYQKLLEIQKQVHHFTKDKEGHNYSYTTGDQVLNKIRPMMNEHGLLLKQEVLDVHSERIDYDTKYSSKSEMFTSVKQLFTWIDSESGEELTVQWHANGMNDWDKGFGSALTYAERYFLLKFFHVPTDEDDPDARQGESSMPRAKSNGKKDDDKPWLNKTQYKSDELTEDWLKVVKRLQTKPEDLEKIFDHYKVNKECRAELESIAAKANKEPVTDEPYSPF